MNDEIQSKAETFNFDVANAAQTTTRWLERAEKFEKKKKPGVGDWFLLLADSVLLLKSVSKAAADSGKEFFDEIRSGQVNKSSENAIDNLHKLNLIPLQLMMLEPYTLWHYALLKRSSN